MTTEPRKTGVGVLGDMPWGTHGCLFYDTQQDLLDAVIPYLRAGLEDHEFCLWVISEPLIKEEALGALRRSVPDLDRHLSERSIEVIAASDWYAAGGVLDLRGMTLRLQEKLEQVSGRGYAGLRATGGATGLGKHARKNLRQYENELNNAIAGHPMLVLCTYPLAQSSAAELLDVTRAHRITAIMRNGDWEIIEAPERTRALQALNEELREEIAERQRVADELRRVNEVLQKIFDHVPIMLTFAGEDGRIQLVNAEWERTLGWTLDEIRKRDVDIIAECYPDAEYREHARNFISKSNGEWAEFKTRVRDGRMIDTSWAVVNLSDGTRVGIGQDITERKQAEERLKTTTKQLRSLSASLQTALEEERSRMARMIHDEFGSTLTSLKWDLEELDKMLSEPVDPSAPIGARARIVGMIKLMDATMATVRRVAWELRPGVLDDLGLVEAIEWQAQQFQSRSGITCQRTRFLEDVRFTKEQATAVFRIFQEALTNILRHARATNVDVAMVQDGAEFVLTVSDNGKGITWIEKSGLGILEMHERARLVGGKIDIQGLEGAGTTITLRVPLGPVSDA